MASEAPKWRRQAPAPGAVLPRRHLVLTLLLAAGLIALAGVALMLYLRPAARVTFVPLFVPSLPWRAQDREAFAESSLFFAHAEPGSLTQEGILRQCAERHGEATVLYLSGPTRTGPEGLSFMPIDADMADPATWLPLPRILEAIKQNGARQVLLVLDAETPGLEPALEAVADPRRLVLASGGILSSEVLQRSVFGHYFEEGLGGQADASGDGRVTVRELAAYLEERVDRWARRVRSSRQVPTLFGSGDFVLADLPNAAAHSLRDLPEDRAYPKWLKEAWAKAGDVPVRLQALAAVERRWRSGVDEAVLQGEASAAAVLSPASSGKRPRPRSLALALAGQPVPARLAEDVRQGLSLIEARTRGLAAEKAAPVKAKAAEAFAKDNKPTPQVLAAIVDAAIADPRPAVVGYAAQLLALLEPQPEYVETLALARLAGLPPPLFVQAMAAVQAGERLASKPRGFGRIRPWVEAATQKRHEALVDLEALGYAPRKRGARLLQEAMAGYVAVQARQDAAGAGQGALDAARLILLDSLAYLRLSGHDLAAWRVAAAEALAVAGKLQAPPDPEAIRRAADDLRPRLAALDEPFTPAGVELRVRASKRGSATPGHWRELDGVLASPRIEPVSRPVAWAAARDLARRLEEDTYRLDREQGRRPGPTVSPPSPAPAADDAGALARVLAAAGQERGLWSWLADRYRYEAREWATLAPDSPTAAFYLRAAADYRDWLSTPETFVEIAEANEPGRLLPSSPVTVVLEARSTPPLPLAVQAIPADDEWLTITPAKAGKERAAFTVALKKDAGTGRAPSPLGFLARAEAGGRGFHRKIPLPLSPRLPEVVFAPVGAKPGPATPRLRLRVVPGRQAFALFVRNPIDKPWAKLVVRLATGDETRQSLPFALGPRETRRVQFAAAPPPAAGVPALPLPALSGALRFAIVDMDGKADLVTTREVAVGLARPGELASVTRARFDPAGGKNRLEVRLRQRGPVAGPDMTATLRLPPPTTYVDGTLRGKLPPEGGELVLFADGVRSNEAAALFSVDIDNWMRAFVFRATLAPRAGTALPTQVDAPQVRIEAAPFGVAGPGYAVPLEVDNAPPGSSLELALGRLEGGLLREELSAKRASSHEVRIGFGLAGGTFAFEASRKDWTIPLDTSRVRGPRTLRARLLDSAGREVAQATKNVTLGDEAAEVRFVSLPPKAWNKAPLTLKAVGEDKAGIASAFFFVGKPVAGKAPDGAARTPAVALDDAKTTWAAKLPLAGKKGPTEISVQMVNRLGLSGFATATVDLTDDDPAKTAPGSISGRVLEGARPQAGLTVTLTDEKGMAKATAKTDADGKYSFKGLAPGKYRLGSTKTSSGRVGKYPRVDTEFLDLAPAADTTADVLLFLPGG